MLTLKPNCERCDKNLEPSAHGAMICSFECTFCQPCAEDVFSNTCPNCGGDLMPRPPRPEHHLARHPGSQTRVTKQHDQVTVREQGS